MLSRTIESSLQNKADPGHTRTHHNRAVTQVSRLFLAPRCHCAARGTQFHRLVRPPLGPRDWLQLSLRGRRCRGARHSFWPSRDGHLPRSLVVVASHFLSLSPHPSLWWTPVSPSTTKGTTLLASTRASPCRESALHRQSRPSRRPRGPRAWGRSAGATSVPNSTLRPRHRQGARPRPRPHPARHNDTPWLPPLPPSAGQHFRRPPFPLSPPLHCSSPSHRHATLRLPLPWLLLLQLPRPTPAPPLWRPQLRRPYCHQHTAAAARWSPSTS